jgi:hypothetical protein
MNKMTLGYWTQTRGYQEGSFIHSLCGSSMGANPQRQLPGNRDIEEAIIWLMLRCKPRLWHTALCRALLMQQLDISTCDVQAVSVLAELTGLALSLHPDTGGVRVCRRYEPKIKPPLGVHKLSVHTKRLKQFRNSAGTSELPKGLWSYTYCSFRFSLHWMPKVRGLLKQGPAEGKVPLMKRRRGKNERCAGA